MIDDESGVEAPHVCLRPRYEDALMVTGPEGSGHISGHFFLDFSSLALRSGYSLAFRSGYLPTW